MSSKNWRRNQYIAGAGCFGLLLIAVSLLAYIILSDPSSHEEEITLRAEFRETIMGGARLQTIMLTPEAHLSEIEDEISSADEAKQSHLLNLLTLLPTDELHSVIDRLMRNVFLGAHCSFLRFQFKVRMPADYLKLAKQGLSVKCGGLPDVNAEDDPVFTRQIITDYAEYVEMIKAIAGNDHDLTNPNAFFGHDDLYFLTLYADAHFHHAQILLNDDSFPEYQKAPCLITLKGLKTTSHKEWLKVFLNDELRKGQFALLRTVISQYKVVNTDTDTGRNSPLNEGH